MTQQGDTLTDLERIALASGHARLYQGRVIPIIRGGENEGGEEEGEDDGDGQGSSDEGADRTFSQSDVDRIVRDRIARVKSAPPADYEDLKAKAKRLSEIEEANKTELDKERDRAEKAEERAQRVEAEAREIRLNAAIIAEAAKPGRKVVDTDAIVRLLDRDTLELDDDGNPTNVAEAMDSLLEARPFLVASNGGTRGSADQGARGGGAKQLSRDDLKSMTPEAIVKARKEGRLDSVLGAS